MSGIRIGFSTVVVLGLMAHPTPAQGPSYSIDFQGPTISLGDFFFGAPITEGDILVPPMAFIPMPGPLPPPAIAAFAGGPSPGPNLGLPGWAAAVGHPPGQPGQDGNPGGIGRAAGNAVVSTGDLDVDALAKVGELLPADAMAQEHAHHRPQHGPGGAQHRRARVIFHICALYAQIYRRQSP